MRPARGPERLGPGRSRAGDQSVEPIGAAVDPLCVEREQREARMADQLGVDAQEGAPAVAVVELLRDREHEGLGEGAQIRVSGRLELVEHRVAALLDAGGVLVEDGVDHAFLAPEVVLDRGAVALAGGLVDLGERGGVDPAIAEQALRGGDDPGPGRDRVGAQAPAKRIVWLGCDLRHFRYVLATRTISGGYCTPNRG